MKPGGRVAVSDIALKKPLPPEIGEDLLAYVGCIAGAVPIEEYGDGLKAAGFAAVQVVDTKKDLNAYAQGRGPGRVLFAGHGNPGRRVLHPGPGGSSACCTPRPRTPPAAGCCGARPGRLLRLLLCRPRTGPRVGHGGLAGSSGLRREPVRGERAGVRHQAPVGGVTAATGTREAGRRPFGRRPGVSR